MYEAADRCQDQSSSMFCFESFRHFGFAFLCMAKKNSQVEICAT